MIAPMPTRNEAVRTHMTTVIRYLRFQPHGDNLLTQSTAFWLISARLFVALMAACESAAWARVGALFGDGPIGWASAVFVGGVIFTAVWLLDLSLITLDRAWGEHAERILGENRQSTAGRRLRDGVTFAIRIALLIGSIWVTVPYLAQLVFARDIAQLTSVEATRSIEHARTRLLARFDPAIAAKDAELKAKRAAYEAEVAGRGESGRYGEGPAAKAKLADAVRLERERDSLLADRGRELLSFTRLAADWRANRDALAAAHNVTLPRSTILQSGKVLEELAQRPEYRQTELTLKAFMWLIFGGLLLLKLFEPRSARLYFSEVLQQEYLRYEAGTFDEWLPSGERSTTGFRMSPQRLYDFLVHTWVPIQKSSADLKEEAARKRRLEEARLEAQRQRDEELRQADFVDQQRKREHARQQEERERLAATARARIAEADRCVDLFRAQATRARDDVRTAYKELLDCRQRADESETSFTDLKSTIVVVERDIEHFDAELDVYGQRLERSRDEQEAADLTGIRASIRQKRADAARALKDLKDSVPGVEQRYERAAVDLSDAEKRYTRAVQRANAFEGRVEKLEQDIATEAIKSGSPDGAVGSAPH